MFYYPNVLQRHSGCFSTIWLAATKGIRVTRRELLRVNVKRTCGEILDYVTAQVPPPQPSLPRPRFSLYLSSQLQYGVVVVYHRQCGFLLEEAQQTIDRLLRSKRCMPIDMAESGRNALDMPTILYMMEEAEGAQDPFFGVMESDLLPSPYKLLQTGSMIEQRSLVPSPHTTQDKDGFRSPPAAITLTEKELFTITTAEYFEGPDLPEATVREIDLLMDQADHFAKDAEEQTEERSGDGAMSSAHQLKETALGADQDDVWLLDEESGQPVAVPLATIALEMTPVQVAMPTPPSGASGKGGDGTGGSPREEAVVPPLRKRGGRRRRQLVFADPQVQISERAMEEQIGNPRIETRSLSEVLLDSLSLTKHATPAQLFSAPCGSLLHADLQTLWKQQASLAILPREEKAKGEVEEGEEEEGRSESVQEREIMRTEKKRRHSSMKEITTESRLQTAEASSVSDVMLDVSREDKSVSDVITPISRWSVPEEVQLPMEPIAEERIEMPEAQTDADSRDMPSWITSSLQRFSEVTFDSLLPPEANRSTASDTFYKLLELLSAGQVTVHQAEPYSCITISPA
ncbi:REC8 meiotic recombination protein b isoform X2 [Archocentrus centrarchus]|uniref:REC8 meiotic recombination protein b isoform X2 n=1 Tax=Archocentrus centrarchus TaxID=63155 RepID=UPI0011E9F18E|nr:meiotic recombination protein REC8 homolog isoform X2 [Archocentrus centrarchus]